MPTSSPFHPAQLGPYAWYDAHLSAAKTRLFDLSLYRRAPITFGSGASEPLRLPYSGEAYVHYPGGNTGNATVAYNFTPAVTDLDIRVKVNLSAPPTNAHIATSDRQSGARNFYWTGSANGMQMVWWENDGTLRSPSWTPATSFWTGVLNTDIWLRVTIDVDNGAGGHAVTFYSSTDGATWTTLATVNAGAFTTSIRSQAPCGFGFGVYNTLGVNSAMQGRLYQGSILNGINGTPLAHFEASRCTQTGYTDAYGVVWTVVRTTSGRKTAVLSPAANSDRSIVLFGTDDYADTPAAAQPPLGTANSATVVAVTRWHATPTNAGRVFSSEATSTNGVLMYPNGAAQMQARLGDGTTSATTGLTTGGDYGKTIVNTAVVNARSTLAFYKNNEAATTASTTSVGAVTNRAGRIGSTANTPGTYQDMEVQALLTFDRALTTAEIANLVGFYRGGL